MNAWIVSVVVWLALLALAAASIAAAVVFPGPAASAFSLACAVAMAALIFGWFMGLASADGLLRVFALAAILWLALMVSLTLLDFLNR